MIADPGKKIPRKILKKILCIATYVLPGLESSSCSSGGTDEACLSEGGPCMAPNCHTTLQILPTVLGIYFAILAGFRPAITSCSSTDRSWQCLMLLFLTLFSLLSSSSSSSVVTINNLFCESSRILLCTHSLWRWQDQQPIT